MKLRQLFNDDDAVSPVIGVILMVAITVILAAVIATFVLGLGEQVSDTAPESSFEFSYDTDLEAGDEDSWGNQLDVAVPGDIDEDGNVSLQQVNATLTITHTGGPTIDGELLGALGSSAEVHDDGEMVEIDYSSFREGNIESMSAGQSVDIFMLEDDSITVVWTSDDGSTSSTLRTFDGPEA